jgi:hypothetical protein
MKSILGSIPVKLALLISIIYIYDEPGTANDASDAADVILHALPKTSYV